VDSAVISGTGGSNRIHDCPPELLSYSWDGDTGAAHVQLTFASSRYIDRFNLIKLNGNWLIMDKVSFGRIYSERLLKTA
jgi:hypothetical protein